MAKFSVLLSLLVASLVALSATGFAPQPTFCKYISKRVKWKQIKIISMDSGTLELPIKSKRNLIHARFCTSCYGYLIANLSCFSWFFSTLPQPDRLLILPSTSRSMSVMVNPSNRPFVVSSVRFPSRDIWWNSVTSVTLKTSRKRPFVRSRKDVCAKSLSVCRGNEWLNEFKNLD